MVSDYLKPHVAKIIIKSSHWEDKYWGSGVIFRAKKDAQFAYLLTARHNFFERDSLDKYKSDSLDLRDFEVKITLGGVRNALLKSVDDKVHFFSGFSNDTFLDIAFLIVDISSDNPMFYDLDVLEVYATYDNEQSKVKNIAAGFPAYAENSLTENFVVKYYNMLFNSTNEDDSSEKMINPDGSLNFYDTEFTDKLHGMSGGGVFAVGKNSKLALRSIIFAAIPTNSFQCVRVDSILDVLNEKIEKINSNYPRIEPSGKVLLENEAISLDEIIEFDYFRNIVREKSKLDVSSIDERSDIHTESKRLNKKYHESKSDMEDLSYQYAHLAVLACERGMRLATTLYFKKAIELNPEHTVGLLLEKAERAEGSDALRNFAPKNIIDIEKNIKNY